MVERDPWADWLLEKRFGGDPALLAAYLPDLLAYRDRVLEGAAIRPGETVLDVGCGDGLLGLAALDRVGDGGTVIFSDVSAELLGECRRITTERDLVDHCLFVNTGLPMLDRIEPDSVDVAMTRSVLIYVEDKATAFATLHRVLKSGGRLSMFEPVNSFAFPEPPGKLWGHDVTDVVELAAKVKRTFAGYLPDPNPMTDFDERDLLAHAEAAGFVEIGLDYRVEIGAEPAPDLDVLLKASPNPYVPPLGEVLDQALTPAEREELVTHLRDQIDAGLRRRRSATVLLTATR